MNNMRKKPALPALLRGGLLCLLFLLPWFSSVKAQYSSYGSVAIGSPSGATLTIEDDDNDNDINSDSWKRRKIIIVGQTDGNENGLVPAKFKVSFFDRPGNTSFGAVNGEKTTAVEDVWVTFEFNPLAVGSTAVLDRDYENPVSFSVVIPKGGNESAEVEIPVKDNMLITGDLRFFVKITGAETKAGEEIPSLANPVVRTEFGFDDTDYGLTIIDKQNSDPSNKVITLSLDGISTLDRYSDPASAISTTITASLPAGITASEDITVNLAKTGTAAAGDYILSPAFITILAGTSSGGATVTAICNDEFSTNKTLGISGSTIDYNGGGVAGFTSVGTAGITINYTAIGNVITVEGATLSGGTYFACADGSVTLTAPAGSAYMWRYNGVAIADAYERTYVVLPSDTEAEYSVEVTNEFGCQRNSLDVNIAFYSPVEAPTITTLSPEVICGTGVTVILNGHASVGGAKYQWYKDGVAEGSERVGIPGDLTVTATGSYTLEAINDDGCRAMSIAKEITFSGAGEAPAKPRITTEGGVTEICGGAGNSIALTAVKDTDGAVYTGAGFTYKWFMNGTEVATTSSNVYHAAAGNYTVMVFQNGCPSTLSDLKVITQAGSGTTITQPDLPDGIVTACSGGSVTLEITNKNAYAAPGFTFQWYEKTKGIIAGEVGIAYTTTEAGVYYVVAKNGTCQSIPSIDKQVTISGSTTLAKPTIEGVDNQKVCVNGSTTLTVANQGDFVGATYQWYSQKAGLLAGETTPSLHVSYATADDKFWVVATSGGCSSAPSDKRTVAKDAANTALVKPQIIPTTTAAICGVGGSVQLEARSTGVAYLAGVTYEWYKDGVLVFTSATTNLYHATEAGSYVVTVSSGSCQSEESAVLGVTVGVAPPATIPNKPILDKVGTISLCGVGSSVDIAITNVSDYASLSPTYQWYINGALIAAPAGVNSQITVTTAGVYTVVVIAANSCSSLVSEEVTVTVGSGTVPAKPSVAAAPSLAICSADETGSVQLSVTNTASYIGALVSYQWYKNGVKIDKEEARQSVYIATAAAAYYVVVTVDGCSSSPSDSQNVTSNLVGTVTAQPTIKSKPDVASPSICGAAGGSVELSVTNTAALSGATYQWYKNHMPISGATTGTYNATDAGKYYVVATVSGCSSIPSAAIDVTRDAGCEEISQPKITPSSTVICGGSPSGSVELHVTKLDDTSYEPTADYTFDWYRNGVYEATTASPYLLATLDGTYEVVAVKSASRSLPSAKVVITKNGSNAPAIPAIDYVNGVSTICDGGSATLEVTNKGAYAADITFQWYEKTRGIITGAVGMAYPAAEAGTYYVVAKSGTCQSAPSADKTLTVSGSTTLAKPLLDTAGSLETCVGGGVTISVTNTSDFAGATYRWYSNGKGLIAGANLPTLFVTHTMANDTFWVVVENGGCGSQPSDKVSVNQGSNAANLSDPQISMPSGTEICGDGASIELVASSTGAPYADVTYTWYLDGVEVFESSTTSRYHATEAGSYIVKVSNGGCQSVASGSKSITMGSSAGIPAKPVLDKAGTVEICGAGASVNIQVTTAYVGATYQWYKNGDPMAGETNPILNATATGDYYVVVKAANGCYSLPSDATNVTVGSGSAPAQPTVAAKPNASGAMCAPSGQGSIELSITNLAAYANPQIQWYKDGSPMGTNTQYLLVTEDGLYTVEVSDGGCLSTRSAAVNVQGNPSGSVIAKPIIVSKPSAAEPTICGATGGSVELSVQNDASHNTQFQWYKNNKPIDGATTKTYNAIDEGTYFVVAYDAARACASVPSDAITVTRSAGSEAVVQPKIVANSTVICGGSPSGSVELHATKLDGTSYEFTAGYTFDWYRNGEYEATTASSYLMATLDGMYEVVVVQSACRSLPSAGLAISKNNGANAPAIPAIDYVNGVSTICDGGSATLEVTNKGAYAADITFQWYEKTRGIITGAVGMAYPATEAGTYYVVAKSGTCQSAPSADRTLTISGSTTLSKPLLDTAGALEACIDGGVTISVTNIDQLVGATYRWYSNGKGLIAGANLPTLFVAHAMANDTFWVVVENGGCESQSSEKVFVNQGANAANLAKPQISTPSGTEICGAGASVELEARTTGAVYPAGVSYEWYLDGEKVFESTTTSRYHALTDGDYIVKVVSGTCQSAASDSKSITMGSSMDIPAKPVLDKAGTIEICGAGASVNIQVTTAYVGATYQWYKNGDPLAGETNPILNVTTTGDYYVIVRAASGCYSLPSDDLNVTVGSGSAPAQPTVAAKPNALGAMCAPSGQGSIELSITNLTAYANPQLQWYKDGAPTGTNSPYLLATIDGVYTVEVSDGGCLSTRSAAVNVQGTLGGNVIARPVIVSKPAALEPTICGATGGSVELSVQNDASHSAQFQWYKNNKPIDGATTRTYNATEIGDYFVVAYDAPRTCASVPSETITVKRNSGCEEVSQPKITPSSTVICGGSPSGSVELFATKLDNTAYAPAAAYTFDWYRNGVYEITTTSPYLTATLDGTYEVVAVKSESRSLPSAKVVITKDGSNAPAAPIIGYVNGVSTICDGGSATLQVTNINSAVTYQWYGKKQGKIDGEVGATYAASVEDTYYVVAKDGTCQSVASNELELTFSGTTGLVQPILKAKNDITAFCIGGSITLFVGNAVDGLTYEWHSVKQGIIIGEVTPTLHATIADTYWVVAKDGSCQSKESDRRITVTENNGSTALTQPKILVEGGQSVLCSATGMVVLQAVQNVVGNTPYNIGVTYTWYAVGNTTPLQEGTSAYYSTSLGGNYEVVVSTGGCQTNVSARQTVTLSGAGESPAKPTAIEGSPSLTICGAGGNVTLTAKLLGATYPQAAGRTFIWHKIDVVTGVETVITTTAPTYNATEAARYKVYVRNADGCQSQMSGEVIVDMGSATDMPVQPIIKSLPTDANPAQICFVNGVVRLKAEATVGSYDAFVQYVWYKNGVEVQRGTNPEYVAQNDASNSSYTVIIQDGGCNSPESVAKQVISNAGGGTFTVAIATAGAGNPVMLTASVNPETLGATYTYAWYWSANPYNPSIDDRVSQSAVGATLVATTSGYYTVVVTRNDGCSAMAEQQVTVTSGGACDSFITPNVVIVYGGGGICSNGGTAMLTVENASVYASQNVTYQWYLANGTPVASATTQSLITSAVGTTSYYVIVTNVDNGCLKKSNEETVVIAAGGSLSPALTIRYFPVGKNICVDGGTVELSVDGGYPLYLWHNLTNGTIVQGDNIYLATEAGEYTVVALDLNSCPMTVVSGSLEVTKNLAPGAVLAKPEVAMNPTTGVICAENGRVALSVTNANTYYTSAAKYHWYNKTTGEVAETDEPLYFAKDGGLYTVVVFDDVAGCGVTGSPESEGVLVSKNTAGGLTLVVPAIAAQGGITQICGADGTGSVVLTVTDHAENFDSKGNVVVYKWYKDGVLEEENGTWTYTATKAGDYLVQVFVDGCGSTESNKITVSSNPSGSGVAKPELSNSDLEVACSGGRVTLSVSTSYSNAAAYMWFKDGHPIIGAASQPTYLASENGGYYVIVTDNNGSGCVSSSLQSKTVTVQFDNASAAVTPEITGDSQFCSGGSALLTATTPANVVGARYSWFRLVAGSLVSITDATNLAHPNLRVTTAGDYVVTLWTPACGTSAPSVVKSVTESATAAPTAPTISGGTSLCAGGSVLLTANAVGVSDPSYQWYKNGETITGATGNTCVVNEAGDYTVTVTEANTCTSDVQSVAHTVSLSGSTAPSAPSISSASNAHNICGDNIAVELKAESAEVNIANYQWFRNGSPINDGTGNAQTYHAVDAGSYAVAITLADGCTSVLTSDPYTLTKNVDPVCEASRIQLVVTPLEIREGESAQVTVKLLDGYVAAKNIDVSIATSGTATRGASCSLSGVDYTLQTAITIPSGQSNVSTTLLACEDDIYDPSETAILTATVEGRSITNAVQTVTILDKYEGGENGGIWLKYKFDQTSVVKGSPASITFTLVAGASETPITTKDDLLINLYHSLAVGIYHNAPNEVTIPAGGSTVVLNFNTIDDGVQTGNLYLNTAAEGRVSVPTSAEPLEIVDPHTNATGGANIVVMLSPSEVFEGISFVLTAEVRSATYPDMAVKAGANLTINVSELASSIAKNGRDYTLPATITIPMGSERVQVAIATVNNELYDGNRRMDISLVPVEAARDKIVSGTTQSGLIKDNDRPCITATPSRAVNGIVGLDDSVDKEVTITFTVSNITETAGPLVLQVKKEGGAVEGLHYNIDGSILMTFTSATPSASIKLVSLLTLSPDADRKTFNVSAYSSIYKELLLSIDRLSPAVDYDCFNPIKIIISDDYDKDGLPNWMERADPNCPEDNGDSNNNGIPNEWDSYDPNADDDGDGIPNWVEDTNRDGNPYNDFAGNSCLPNFMNPDSDGDGVPDSVEKWDQRPYDDNKGDIRIHPALSLNDDGVGNDYMFIENIEKYDNVVKIFDRQGIVVFEKRNYTNSPEVAFKGYPNKGNTSKKVPMGTYFYSVEYTNRDTKEKKYYSGYVEIRY